MLILIVVGGMATDAITGGSSSVSGTLLMIGLALSWGYMSDLIVFMIVTRGYGKTCRCGQG